MRGNNILQTRGCISMVWQPRKGCFTTQETSMKKLALLLVAVASLAGCVAVPYDSGRPHRPHGGPYYGDRDRDGIPNRADRDRDGDGVRNRDDRRPDNPRRY